MGEDRDLSRRARPLSLAAYGFVGKDGGSVASASYLVLERLLELGHLVDFHAIGGFVEPRGLIGCEGFTYVPTSQAMIGLGWRFLEGVIPPAWRKVPEFGYSLFSNARHERAIARVIASRHAARPYDALLVLGTLSPFRVPGLPCASWPQGPPGAEWESLQAHKSSVIQYGGRILFAALKRLYAHKQKVCRRQIPNSDVVIGCSRWSAKAWGRAGVPAERLRAVPYAYDLDAFRPVERVEESPALTRFLWLGRIVPRKRLDLLLHAFRSLRAEREDVALLIIGQFTYPRGLRRLLDEFADTPGITYRASVARDQVPDLFRSVDAVVQPSENENLGSSVLEGICCGVPAIVGPSNGSKDYLGASSVIFDEYTPESLRNAMTRIADTPRADRSRVAGDSRLAAESFLSSHVVTMQILDAIRDATLILSSST